MITTNLNKLDLNEISSVEDSKQHCKVTFPLLDAHGTKSSSTVYFELEPGDNVGRHSDSAEELLLIVEGDVEVTIGDENMKAEAGNIALVPQMVPHDVKNTGQSNAKVLGFFGGANHIVATFDKGWMPDGNKVVDTAAMFEQSNR